MRRTLLGIAAAILLVLGLAAPALAAEPLTHDGSVRFVGGGELTIPAGEHVDTVIAAGATVIVKGEVNAIVVVDGTLRLEGATTEAVVAVGSTVSLDAATTVLGDVRTLDTTVDRADGAEITGSIRGLETDLINIGLVLAPLFILFAIGLAIASVVAGLALAALAAKQVRAAEALIRNEPGPVLIAGLIAMVVLPLVAVAALFTVIGAPVGIGLLVVVWPAVALLGYLVAGIFIGEWVLERLRGPQPAERPYLAAVVGVLILQVIGFIPLVGAIASLFGFGAVVLLTWRTFRGEGVAAAPVNRSSAQPIGA
jgi:hypothetical protein